jgi:hypothetical protein
LTLAADTRSVRRREETHVDMGDFENVRHQIGSCGAWCGSCVVGNGVLKELTKKYQEMIDAYGLREWGPGDFDYAEFAKGLQSIQAISSCPGCVKGGGRENCEIRACASDRGFRECTECGAGDDCSQGKVLDHMRAGALAAGILFRTGEPNRDVPVEEWESQLASKWPCSILFDDDG